MAEVCAMWKFYKAVMQSAIKEFWTATDQMLTAIAVLSFFGILANRKYAEKIVTAWNGISPWWSTIPIFLLVVYRLLHANYEKYSRVKAALDALTPPFAVAEEDPKVYLRPLNDQFVARGVMAFEVLNDGQRVNPAEGITVHTIPSIPLVRFEYIDVLRANQPKTIIPVIGDDIFPSNNILSELDKAWRQAWESEESKNEVMVREAEFPFEIKIAYHDSKRRTFEATTNLRYCPVEHQAALSAKGSHGDILKVVPSAEPRFRRLS
jgi:hypothetical protein